MAGFIGIMKRDGVKVMAGVAVATACMPPLCTAGFGIANGDWGIFLGGLYFYSINCLFIGLATFITSRITGYHNYFKRPASSSVLARSLWILFIILMLVPSLVIVLQKWQEQKVAEKASNTERTRIELLEQKVQILDSILQTK